MKHYKRLNLYKNSTGTNVFNPETLTATSYGWWTYLKVIKGLLVFNNITYSNTTSKHQNNLRTLLRELQIPVDITIEAPRGLTDLDGSILHYKYLIGMNKARINRPRTRTMTKERLTNENEYLKQKIRQVRELMN